jgi:hypothetical protein
MRFMPRAAMRSRRPVKSGWPRSATDIGRAAPSSGQRGALVRRPRRARHDRRNGDALARFGSAPRRAMLADDRFWVAAEVISVTRYASATSPTCPRRKHAPQEGRRASQRPLPVGQPALDHAISRLARRPADRGRRSGRAAVGGRAGAAVGGAGVGALAGTLG